MNARIAHTLSACLLLIIVSIGCSQSGPELGEVTGTVTLDGAPLPMAKIIFQPVERGGQPSEGLTDEAGAYQLIYDRERTGALVGDHTVIITTARQLSSTEPGGPGWTPEKLPAKYHEKTELKKTVESGGSTIDFTLTSQ